MAGKVDPRSIETSRYQVEGAPPSDALGNPDNEATDLSLPRVASPRALEGVEKPEARESHEEREAHGELAVTDILQALPADESPWRLNGLGSVLLTALVCAIAICGVLGLKLSRTRADLAEAETAAENAEAAVAREPAEMPDEPKVAVHPIVKPADEPPHVAQAPQAAPAAREQLLLLLTVGSQHYAEKQLHDLKLRCDAPLAVYRQRRGRCAFEQCFVVAAPASEAESARECGQVKGQARRDRDDFLLLP